MRNYKQPGDVLTFTAPAGGVVSGGAYKIGQIVVVAAGDAIAGAPFSGKTTGVFELPKDVADATTEGQLLYWDAGNARVTTVATGSLLCGVSVGATTATTTPIEVRLDGVARPDEA